MEGGAVFDKRRRYRYLLWRRWDPSLPVACFVMLNPSTADESRNDPTITRCVNFAQRWRFGGVNVVNAFALRATDCGDLYCARNPVGELTDAYILSAVAESSQLIVAWGNHGRLDDRHFEVLDLLTNREMFGFDVTLQHQPKHPLYVRNDAELRLLRRSPEGVCLVT